MTTYYDASVANQREKERANPFLDLNNQILVPRSAYAADINDDLAVKQVLIEATSGTPFWGNDPGAYETIRFAKNIYLPGQCKIRGKGFEQRLQRDKPPGTHGHSVKQLGIQPAKIDITVRMWTEQHLATFQRLVPILLSQKYTSETVTEAVGFTGNAAPGSSSGAGFSGVATASKTKQVAAGPRAIDIYHPLLALFKIRSVHITGVGIPEPTGEGNGAWEAKIECEQFIYKPAKVKLADESMEIVERNPRIGKTGATLAGEQKSKPKKPSSRTSGGHGASGSW